MRQSRSRASAIVGRVPCGDLDRSVTPSAPSRRSGKPKAASDHVPWPQAPRPDHVCNRRNRVEITTAILVAHRAHDPQQRRMQQAPRPLPPAGPNDNRVRPTTSTPSSVLWVEMPSEEPVPSSAAEPRSFPVEGRSNALRLPGGTESRPRDRGHPFAAHDIAD